MKEQKKASMIQLKRNVYDFETMEGQLYPFVVRYPFVKLQTIGESVWGRPLYKLSIGNGSRKIHINGSHHGNEWITSFVLMKSLEYFCLAHKKDKRVKAALEAATYDFVPMVNPDGVHICIHGIKYIVSPQKKRRFLEMNEGLENFSRWKANLNGVDLNRNYDAGFESYQKISEKKAPSYALYAGEKAESEPETKSLVKLTKESQYDMVLAYHTQGEVLYWTYGSNMPPEAEKYATMFEKASGYLLEEPEALAASGGYKDWFIAQFHKPGFTVECGRGENPIAVNQWQEILNRTLPLLILAAEDIK